MRVRSQAGPARSAGSASLHLSVRAEPRSGTHPGCEGSAGGAGILQKMSDVTIFFFCCIEHKVDKWSVQDQMYKLLLLFREMVETLLKVFYFACL